MKTKYILLSVLLFSLFNLTVYGGDDHHKKDHKKDHHKKDTYKLKIKHITKGTEVIATCDNGYYKKQKAKKDELKFKLSKDADCILHITMKNHVTNPLMLY